MGMPDAGTPSEPTTNTEPAAPVVDAEIGTTTEPAAPTEPAMNTDTNVDMPPLSTPEILRAWAAADPDGEGWEALLYTDAELYGGEITAGMGPFQIFPTHSDILRRGVTAPRFVLRARYTYKLGNGPGPSLEELTTNAKWWLNLALDEQVASLVSLALGVRMRSGGKVRHFNPAEDPAGRPRYMAHQAPIAPPFAVPFSALPGLAGCRVDLRHTTTHLALMPRIAPEAATVLLRAARHFSTALWIVDSDPEQAWLQLVTAAEVAATHHQRGTTDIVELFTDFRPKVVKWLDNAGGEQLVTKVAKEFKGLLRATDRFLTFFRDFPAPEPAERPTIAAARLEWTPESLEEALKQVYNLRSRLLHDGHPFPAPLLQPPSDAGTGRQAERPFGDGYGAGNAVWLPEELPMFLPTFAHMTHMALLAWWRSLAATDE